MKVYIVVYNNSILRVFASRRSAEFFVKISEPAREGQWEVVEKKLEGL